MEKRLSNGHRSEVIHQPPAGLPEGHQNGVLPLVENSNIAGIDVIEIGPRIVYRQNPEGKRKPRRVIQVSFDGIPLRKLSHRSDSAPEAIVFEPGTAVPESLLTPEPPAEPDTAAPSSWFPFPLDDKFINAFKGTGIGNIHGLRRAFRSGVIKDIMEYKGLSQDDIAELRGAIIAYEEKRRRRGA